MPITDASNFVFFQLINDYLRDEINTFQWNLLTSMAQFVGAIGLILLTVWILFQGYRIVTGRTQQPMMALVGDALKATLIIGIATGAASVSSSLYWTLTDGTAGAITSLVSQDSVSPYQSIDKNLAYMQGMLSAIDTLASGGDPSVDSAKERAKWFSGIGIAGPGLVGGSILLLNKIAIALFVGFGPLFIICLLFEQTKSLFSKWLFYGIGTVFSLAVLSFMVGLANNVIRSVAVAFLAKYAALLAGGDGGIDGEGITSLALQQGGLGLVLTLLIVSAPSMAAAFFRGVLGQFQAYSPFGMLGGGSGRGQPLVTSGYQTALTDSERSNSGRAAPAPLSKFDDGASAFLDREIPDLLNRAYGPGALVNVQMGRMSPAVQETNTSPTAWDYKTQAARLSHDANQLQDAEQWARSRGLNVEANDYRDVAQRAYYASQSALQASVRMNAQSLGELPQGPASSPFAPGWNTGEYSAGVQYRQGANMPDYVGVQVGLYVASGGIAVNLHNGEVSGQWSLSRSYPAYSAKPGVTLLVGRIIDGRGVTDTSEFLAGGGAQLGGFAPTPIPLLGVGGGLSHSYGGKTAIELGISFPPGVQTSPAGYGFELKSKNSK